MGYTILLACAAGFSTSILVDSMKKEARSLALDVIIDAVSEGELDHMIGIADVVLLGPQVGHLQEKLMLRFIEYSIPIEVIPIIDYGNMNGKRVLHQALETIEKKGDFR